MIFQNLMKHFFLKTMYQFIKNFDKEVEFHSNVLSYSSLSKEAIEKAVNISEFIIPVFIASVEELEKLRAYSAADLEHLEKVKDAALKFNNLIKFRVEAHGFEENKNKLQELGVDLYFNSLGAEVFGELNSRDALKDGQIVMADDSKPVSYTHLTLPTSDLV